MAFAFTTSLALGKQLEAQLHPAANPAKSEWNFARSPAGRNEEDSFIKIVHLPTLSKISLMGLQISTMLWQMSAAVKQVSTPFRRLSVTFRPSLPLSTTFHYPLLQSLACTCERDVLPPPTSSQQSVAACSTPELDQLRDVRHASQCLPNVAMCRHYPTWYLR